MTQTKIYNFFTDKFLNAANRHAPLKKKTLRGNQAPFLIKELRKRIFTIGILIKKIKHYIKKKEIISTTDDKKQLRLVLIM